MDWLAAPGADREGARQAPSRGRGPALRPLPSYVGVARPRLAGYSRDGRKGTAQVNYGRPLARGPTGGDCVHDGSTPDQQTRRSRSRRARAPAPDVAWRRSRQRRGARRGATQAGVERSARSRQTERAGGGDAALATSATRRDSATGPASGRAPKPAVAAERARKRPSAAATEQSRQGKARHGPRGPARRRGTTAPAAGATPRSPSTRARRRRARKRKQEQTRRGLADGLYVTHHLDPKLATRAAAATNSSRWRARRTTKTHRDATTTLEDGATWALLRVELHPAGRAPKEDLRGGGKAVGKSKGGHDDGDSGGEWHIAQQLRWEDIQGKRIRSNMDK